MESYPRPHLSGVFSWNRMGTAYATVYMRPLTAVFLGKSKMLALEN